MKPLSLLLSRGSRAGTVRIALIYGDSMWSNVSISQEVYHELLEFISSSILGGDRNLLRDELFDNPPPLLHRGRESNRASPDHTNKVAHAP